MVVEPIKIEEYKTETTPTWCPGCGDFAVLRGIHTALARLKIKSEHVVISSGIGCSSNLPGFVNAYASMAFMVVLFLLLMVLNLQILI